MNLLTQAIVLVTAIAAMATKVLEFQSFRKKNTAQPASPTAETAISMASSHRASGLGWRFWWGMVIILISLAGAGLISLSSNAGFDQAFFSGRKKATFLPKVFG